VGFLKLELRFAEKGKVEIAVENEMIAGVGLEPNRVWAPCCETWLKFEIEALRCGENFKVEKKREKKCSGRGCPLSWAPCCERTKSWVLGCE